MLPFLFAHLKLYLGHLGCYCLPVIRVNLGNIDDGLGQLTLKTEIMIVAVAQFFPNWFCLGFGLAEAGNAFVFDVLGKVC